MRREPKVLVTGAAGFIGSHLCEALVKKECRVVGMIGPQCDIRWIENLNMELVRADITRKDTLYHAVKGVKTIYHLAGLRACPDTERLFQINLQGTKNLVDVCLETDAKIEKFVFASSSTIIGPTSPSEIFTEEDTCRPVSDYGRSKLQTEEFLESKKDVLPFTVIRLPLVYGPRNFAGLYTAFKLINRGIRIEIGHGETNVGYVSDIVEGLIRAVESPRTSGERYFVGEDKASSVQEMYECIENALGKRTVRIKPPFPLMYGFALFSEAKAKMTHSAPTLTKYNLKYIKKYPVCRIGMGKAKRDFGYRTKVPLSHGVEKTVRWYRENGYL